MDSDPNWSEIQEKQAEKIVCIYLLLIINMRGVPRIIMSGKMLLIGTVIILLFLSCHFNSFPTVKEVDMVFIQYRKETDNLKKTDLIKGLLKRLSATETVEDDKIIEYAISRLINEYKSTEDEAILLAVDSTKLDGGFMNFTCQFYKEVKQNKKFIQRCQNDPAAIKAFRRCVGITLSEEDLRNIGIGVSRQPVTK